MRAKKSHSKIENQTGPLIQYFGKLYKEKVGEFYPPTWGRDSKMFKDMLVLYPKESLEEMLDMYFETEARIYSIPFFKVALSYIVQAWVKRKNNKPRAIDDNESWRFG